MDTNYRIKGKPVPYRPDLEPTDLGEIAIDDSGLRVTLHSPFGPLTCECEIWEHTIYELEQLSSALRCAAAGPFPTPFELQRPESQIGINVKLPLAADIEVGYSLANPKAGRAKFTCLSRNWRKTFAVFVSLAVRGGFAEVVMDPAEALNLADWLDQQIRDIYADAQSEPTI